MHGADTYLDDTLRMPCPTPTPVSAWAPRQLQEDKDFHHWGVDFHSIYWRAQHHGSMDVIRRPMVDFDPHTLRRVLPSAARVVAEALQGGKRCVRLTQRLRIRQCGHL